MRQVDPHVLRRVVDEVLKAYRSGSQVPVEPLRDAVRMSLAVLSRTVPGRAVEVRVPPYGAAQCSAGPRHNRGQPSNVVETDPLTWVRLASGDLAWSEATESGVLHASGIRSDLSAHLPLVRASRGDTTCLQ
jgi:hypothetical protein